MRPWVLGLVVYLGLAACSRTPSKPLSDAILGEWEVWCRTDDESKSTCLGREAPVLVKTFAAGGDFSMAVRGRTDPPQRGHWSLDGDKLTIASEGGGLKIVEEYLARTASGRLILWYPSGPFGTVLGRAGAFQAAPSPSTSGAPLTAELGGVHYAITLPAGYRVTRDDNNRRSYGPASGPGFVVNLSVSPRGQTEVNGTFVTPPCNEYDYGGVTSSGGEVGGAERETIDIGKSICIAGADTVLSCSAGHTRGWLEAAEKAAALALCTSVKLAGSP